MTYEIGGNTAPMVSGFSNPAAANARNTTASSQETFTQALESANTSATSSPLSPPTGTRRTARKEARYWANFAENLLAMIGEAMVNHNRHLDLMENHWANIERLYGPEMAAKLKAEDTTLGRHEKIIRAAQVALTGAFDVTGEIAMKDAEGNYHFGDFVLSRMGEGFSLRIDSSLGAGVIYGKKSGSSGYDLVSTIESAFLPWTLDDEDEEKKRIGHRRP